MLDVEQAAQARPKGGRELGLLSEVMVAGTPKRDTQPAKRALAQSAAVMEASGMASGHLNVRSMMVNVGVAARRRQRPDQVHVEVGETAVRYRNLRWL